MSKEELVLVEIDNDDPGESQIDLIEAKKNNYIVNLHVDTPEDDIDEDEILHFTIYKLDKETGEILGEIYDNCSYVIGDDLLQEIPELDPKKYLGFSLAGNKRVNSLKVSKNVLETFTDVCDEPVFRKVNVKKELKR